jgi:hypothetical protein
MVYKKSIKRNKKSNGRYKKQKYNKKRKTKKIFKGGKNIKKHSNYMLSSSQLKEQKIKDLQQMYKDYHQLKQSQEPILRPLKMNIDKLSTDEIVPISEKILHQLIQNYSYSLFPYYFRKHDKSLKDHDDCLIKEGNGNCVAFAKAVQQELLNHNIHSYMIPATLPKRLIQPGYPALAHITTIVKTHTHFILHEPAHFLTKPILVDINGQKKTINVSVFGEKWYFQYVPEQNKIIVLLNDNNENYHYDLQELLNIEQAISYPVNILNRRIPSVSFDPVNNNKLSHLSIRLDKGLLEGYHHTYKLGNKEEKGWFPQLDWVSILSNQHTSFDDKYNKIATWDGLSDEQLLSLGYKDPETTREKVYAILKTAMEENHTSRV